MKVMELSSFVLLNWIHLSPNGLLFDHSSKSGADQNVTYTPPKGVAGIDFGVDVQAGPMRLGVELELARGVIASRTGLQLVMGW